MKNCEYREIVIQTYISELRPIDEYGGYMNVNE